MGIFLDNKQIDWKHNQYSGNHEIKIKLPPNTQRLGPLPGYFTSTDYVTTMIVDIGSFPTIAPGRV